MAMEVVHAFVGKLDFICNSKIKCNDVRLKLRPSMNVRNVVL
jgi:hypothetical protein